MFNVVSKACFSNCSFMFFHQPVVSLLQFVHTYAYVIGIFYAISWLSIVTNSVFEIQRFQDLSKFCEIFRLFKILLSDRIPER